VTEDGRDGYAGDGEHDDRENPGEREPPAAVMPGTRRLGLSELHRSMIDPSVEFLKRPERGTTRSPWAVDFGHGRIGESEAGWRDGHSEARQRLPS
jgi:hypothetical protein